MAVRVIFSDPLTDLSYRNYVKTVEDCCFASGLRSRHFAVSPVVTFGPNGPIAGGEHSHSRIYNSVSSNEPNPTVAAKVVEQVQIDQVGAIFRTWIYGGWALQKARIAELLTPGLDAVSGIVGLASVRLEYANQFRMNEDLDAHPLKDLFRDNSPWLSPNALNFKDMWHCHTGAMTQLDSDKKAVELVNIDRIDIPSSIGTAAVRRVLNILAGVEERTPQI